MGNAKMEMNWEQLNALTAEVIGESGPGSKDWNGEGSHTRRFNQALIEEFRKNGGRVPGELADVPLLVLHTTGARTGIERPVPLAYFEVDGRLLVIASMGGARLNPPWYHNLVKHPEVRVELGGESFDAEAIRTEGADRDDLFRKVCELMPVFAEYQSRTERRIPVFELRRRS